MRFKNSFVCLFRTLGCTLVAALVTTSVLHAVRTESIVHEGFVQLDKGTFENVGITFDGKLFPTRDLKEYATIPANIIWDVIAQQDGQLIVSTGNNGTVYRVDAEGKAAVIFQPEESLSRAIAVDDQGRIYVGTSPKGRVYRLLPDGTQEIFFDPPDLYIWDIKIGPDAMIYIATGGKGKIYRVPQTYRMGEEGETFFEASEIHVNHMAFTHEGSELIAGCGTGGNLYRIRMDGTYQAIYHSGADEIKSILPQPDGSIVFSTFTATTASGSSSRPTSKTEGEEEEIINPFAMTVFARELPESNGVMHLDPQGNVRPIWALPPNKIFSVLMQPDGRWLIGSGTNGRVFQTEGVNEWSNVFAVRSGGEVTKLLPVPGSEAIYVVSSNPASISVLTAETSADAIYTSEVIDTGKMVTWGSLRYLSVTGAFHNHVEVSARTGNIADPNRSWSDWQKIVDGRINNPGSRFLQYRVHLMPENPGIQRVQVYFQEQNLHPTLDQIRILPGAYSLFAGPRQPQNVNLSKVFSGGGLGLPQRVPQLVRDKEEGAITAVWLPGDPNRDRLLFDLDLRKVGDETWIRVAKELAEPLMAMDIRGLDEGYYQIRVTADDSLDNLLDRALRFSRVSDPFLIDFTSPQVEVEEVRIEETTVTISLVARDHFGVIDRAFYSLNGGHIMRALPLDGMFDAMEEKFELKFPRLAPGDYSFVFQAYDENGNAGVATQTFSIP